MKTYDFNAFVSHGKLVRTDERMWRIFPSYAPLARDVIDPVELFATVFGILFAFDVMYTFHVFDAIKAVAIKN